MHTVFLPVPDMVHEEQVLYQLPDIYMGLHPHVHAAAYDQEFLHMVTVHHGTGTDAALGIHIQETS